MKRLEIFELAAKPESKLRALYREVFNAAPHRDQSSEFCRGALASMANIQRMIISRARSP